MSHDRFLFEHIYGSLIGKIGMPKAIGWTNSTALTYKDGAYDDLDTLIRDNISCALGIVTSEMLGEIPYGPL